jgi:ubiquinone/menaquinone biosynthesis C-methylase UbiE
MAVRKAYQGVYNVVRFNWHFYVIAFVFVCLLSVILLISSSDLKFLIELMLYGLVYTIVASLLITYYVYDISSLYTLQWLSTAPKPHHILNINAGFDETSSLLEDKYPESNLTILDFYDPAIHTEVSIKRARKAYPVHPSTISISTLKIPLHDESIDLIVICLAAHEIRDDQERIIFFKEISRIVKKNGSIYVIEHLRDLPNFMAYTIGFFHFLSPKVWKSTFHNANLIIKTQQKITPFITAYNLKYGNTH